MYLRSYILKTIFRYVKLCEPRFASCHARLLSPFIGNYCETGSTRAIYGVFGLLSVTSQHLSLWYKGLDKNGRLLNHSVGNLKISSKYLERPFLPGAIYESAKLSLISR